MRRLLLIPALTAAASLHAQTIDVVCRPALPFFCSNIHVACSGRTELKTFAFRLRADAGRGAIESPADAAGILARYAGAQAHWGEDAPYVILRPREGAGYIKLLPSGKYSFRHYVHGEALMSYGHCD